MKRNTERVQLDNPESMGDRIKLARERAHLTQAALAQRLGITAGAVGQWEINRNGPETGKVGPLAYILNVSVDWLLGKQRDSEPPYELTAATDGDRQLIEEARHLGEEPTSWAST